MTAERVSTGDLSLQDQLDAALGELAKVRSDLEEATGLVAALSARPSYGPLGHPALLAAAVLTLSAVAVGAYVMRSSGSAAAAGPP